MNDILRLISFVHLAHRDEHYPYKLNQMLSFSSLDIVIRKKDKATFSGVKTTFSTETTRPCESIDLTATALVAALSSYSGPLDGDSAKYYFYNLKMLYCSA